MCFSRVDCLLPVALHSFQLRLTAVLKFVAVRSCVGVRFGPRHACTLALQPKIGSVLWSVLMVSLVCDFVSLLLLLFVFASFFFFFFFFFGMCVCGFVVVVCGFFFFFFF